MKTLLGLVLISMMLVFGACTNAAPQQPAPAAQGQPGPAGPQGDQGQQGQTGDQGRPAPCPAGQHRHTNPDSGRVTCEMD